MRAAVIGSVGSSAVAVRAVASSDLDLVGVAGYEPPDVSQVSDWADLRPLAEASGAAYLPFTRVNDPGAVAWLAGLRVDYLFVIGLSQLVSAEVIGAAARGCIGYHPTRLPEGRGRAPVAWIVLEQAPAASTLFELTLGADEGGILEQEPFAVDRSMDAADVTAACSRTLRVALDRLLPRLAAGWWAPAPQDADHATWLGKRDAHDGLIDWTAPAEQVDRLIRAAAAPHPGAYCYSQGRRLVVGRSLGVVDASPRQGVVGSVVRADEPSYDVQCGTGVVRIAGVTDEDGRAVRLREGVRLRTPVEDELHVLRARVEELSRLVADLTEWFRPPAS